MAAPPPPPPPPPPTRSWADIPADCLDGILGRVPCPVDRSRALLACDAWRASAAILPLPAPPRALPWLLLPTAAPPFPDGSALVACILSGGLRAHHYLNVTPPGARCFGSHDGAWLFLGFRREPRSHQLLNVRTGEVRALPTTIERLRHYGDNTTILAAALSSSPDDPTCVLAAIVTSWPDPEQEEQDAVPPCQGGFAFWRMGSALPLHEIVDNVDGSSASTVEDLAYHDGAFQLLPTNMDDILTLNPSHPYGIRNPGDEGRFFHPRRFVYEQFVRARYLVVSRGELLLVVRFAPHPAAATSAFKVFAATERQMPDDGVEPDTDYPVADYPWAWRELHTLGGRMLFVGRGCSRSYEVDQYPGFSDAIYFFDDGEFYSFANGDAYRCSDNGVWSEGRVQRCFPRSGPSEHSPPAWLLP